MQQKGDPKKTRRFLENSFAHFYEERFQNDKLPSHLAKREFGFLSFKENLMIRHLQFKTSHEIKNFITSFTPLHAYYSSAYYTQPTATMDKKDWRGADLVFDIDADHLELPCKSKHAFWVCSECSTPTTQYYSVCPSCKNPKLKREAWLCDTCLALAKTETIKLLDFLLQDLGVNLSDLEIRFSGHRGYHICVTTDEIKHLDQAARKEIVDYVLGTGLKIELHGLAKTSGRHKRMIGPNLHDAGWKGRIARGLYTLLTATTTENLTGIPKFTSKKRDRILHEWEVHGNPWRLANIDVETWNALTSLGAHNQSAHVDTVVTTDLHRLIRLPNTLHGKTGLQVTMIPYAALDAFDPLTDGVAFHTGLLEVHVHAAHKFRIKDELYGPFKDETVELPLAAGIFLLCKKAAQIT